MENIFKKNIIYLIIFLIFIIVLYLDKTFSSNPIPYINTTLYFFTFLIVKDLLKITKFNIEITFLFCVFFCYVSILLPLFTFIPILKSNEYLEYFLIEFFLRIIIMTMILYLFSYSHRLLEKFEIVRILVSCILSIIIVSINNYKYFREPLSLTSKNIWEEWTSQNFVLMVVSILFLLIFWYRYYLKKIIVSEYLNSIIFIFTLINILEPLHIIAERWNLDNWFKGQMVNLILNALMMILWYARLVYLKSEESIENERYLMNFQYLNGFVAKPHKSILSTLFMKSTTHAILLFFVGITIITIFLYITKNFTFFLLWNTFFISIIVLLALFFSINSIKRDWQNQINIFLKDKNNK
ncbi:MAG: hypothetical protein A2Y94_07815 [Caldithrix sp. RBG_13_44_9]|nr:MAG: hypothetical protein A2Y94_07815 [Caldithrix sp. RBG_13_44_9]